MPAERVSGAVPVHPNPRAQPPRFGEQLLARHGFEVLVHNTSLLAVTAVCDTCCRLNVRLGSKKQPYVKHSGQHAQRRSDCMEMAPALQ